MKQAILANPQVFKLQDVPTPEISGSQALIKIHAVGICGSDIHAYYGNHPFISTPIVMGHEAAGEIVEIGSDSNGLKVGDRVILRPQQVCGECLLCKSNRCHSHHLELYRTFQSPPGIFYIVIIDKYPAA
jgi:L-iditol 2-dehydrogenase